MILRYRDRIDDAHGRVGAQNKPITGIDKEWMGAIPATWLYDRNGVRRYFKMERFDTDELEKKIVELLEK